MAKKEERFIKVHSENFESELILVDKETGVNYLFVSRGYAGGLTPLLDAQGKVTFSVTAPETIAGITGTVSASGGRLTFDGNALAFTLLADGQVSPVSGPWLLMKTLRSGYLTSCGMEEGSLRIAIDDSYEDDALHLDVWLDGQDAPIRGEIMWQGRRLLTIGVKIFTFV